MPFITAATTQINTSKNITASVPQSAQPIALRTKGFQLDENFLPHTTNNETKTITETQTQSGNAEKEPILSLPKPSVSGWTVPREEKLQEWEGQVVMIDEAAGIFVANLTDLTVGDTVESEEGDFSISDLSDSDRELLETGAIFHWIVGYKYMGTTRERFSRVAFRNLPRWSEAELAAADKEAENLNAIEWD